MILSRSRAPVAGGFVGFLVFASSLGVGLIDPQHIDWLLHGDWSTHFLGWHLYRNGPWSMPLGATPLLAYPVGSSVGLTDSIPIAAIFFKALRPLLPPDFQYFGWWLLSCFTLQGVFAGLLMRIATPRVGLQIIGATLLLLSPPLLFRVVHPALSAHWLLLAVLWLYFRKPFDALSPRAVAAWTAIAVVASATHPYLAFMVLLLTGAAHVRQAILTPSAAWRALVQLTSLMALCAVILWQCGYFMVGSSHDLQAAGLGFHSLNLLSPIMPMGDTLFSAAPAAFATPGQYEGYAYFGAGMIALAVVALLGLPFVVRGWRRFDWQHLPFALACVLLTILALSPQVTIGERTILNYSPEWWGPLTLFRSSGRLFWPVYYVIGFAVLVAVTRLPYRIAFTLLTLATALQLADTTGHFRAAAEHRALGFNSPLKSSFWTIAPAHYQRLTLVPSNICSPAIFFDARPFILLAGRHQLAINAGAAARFDANKVQQHCAELGAELRHGIVTNDQLYVLSRDTATMFKRAAASSLVCTTEDAFSVCFSAQSYAVWQDTYDVVTAGWPSLADVTAFVNDLDVEYRTTLQRGPLQAPGSTETRVKAIVRYLAHRTRGCTHAAAQAAAVRDTRGGGTPGVCAEMTMTAGELPPPNETLDFRRSLERVSPESETMSRSPTHVDPEGEAVWVQEYARARLAGATHSDARNQVLRRIRN